MQTARATSKQDISTNPPAARGALASLALATLLASLGTSIANVGLPAMAQAFAAPFQDVQWVVLAYLLAVTALIVSAGRLGDLAGRRRVLLGGLGLFTLASLACAAAPTLGALIAARAAQGLGAAAMMALTMAMVGEAVPKERTGSAMGLLGTMSAVGTALGPSLGGLLLSAFGWPALFLANVPLGLAALLLARRCLPADRPTAEQGAQRFDKLGTLLLAATLAAYALATTLGRGHFGPLNLGLLAAAGLGAGLFVRAEAKAASPLVRLAAFRDPALSTGLMLSGLVMTVMMTTLVVGPFHLAHALGLNAALAGLAMSAGPAVSALTGAPAGRLVDRFGPARMVVLGLAGMATGSILLAAMPLGAGVPGYVAPLVVLTAGYALFQAANNTAVMKDVRPDLRGGVSGLLNLSRNLGLFTGASAMGAVFALGTAAADVAAAQPDAVATATATRTTFAVAAALVFVAVAVLAGSRRLAARRTAGA